MKISYNWLGTLLQTGLSPSEMAGLLTASGLEVESAEAFESVKGGLRGVVTGEVISCEKHPQADRLKVTLVNTGASEPLHIVCGAPNVAKGQKVLVATVGTTLYPAAGDPLEIKKAKIRGEMSEGMICAEDELGLGESHAGIMVLPEDTSVGMPASEFFRMENDTVFEIGLTPNRSDAASHLGVARDLSALLALKHGETHQPTVPGLHDLPEAAGKISLRVKVDARDGCPRYSGLLISGVKVGPSPEWLANRLRAVGVRPINNIVDITNFVMHETGQPLHAFDADSIKGLIHVRRANEGEKMIMLDRSEARLTAADLLIADDDGGLCIAGVFGGDRSGVTAATKNIFIESAHFDAASVRHTARRLGLRTDASFRFERGTDPEMTVTALNRAANLVFDIAGGVLEDVTEHYPDKLPPFRVAFSYKNCSELIGKDIEKATIRKILLSLGITIDSEGNDGLLLFVPRFKSEVTREADVIEEVMRIYGYDHVEPSKRVSYVTQDAKNDDAGYEEKLGTILEGLGYSEMMGLSMSRESYYEGKPVVKLVNPLSAELAVMRADLLHGMLAATAYNINRRNKDLRLFETGKIYSLEDGKYTERKQLGILATGSVFATNAYGFSAEVDHTFMKGTIESLFSKAGITKTSQATEGGQGLSQAAGIKWKGKQLVAWGPVDPSLLKKFDIGQPVYFAVIDLDTCIAAMQSAVHSFTELPKYPEVSRDLALLIAGKVRFEEIEALAFATEKKLLRDVKLFDIYEDKKLGGKKSYGVRFTLQDQEATLTDKQIDQVMSRLVKAYGEKLGAELRT